MDKKYLSVTFCEYNEKSVLQNDALYMKNEPKTKRLSTFITNFSGECTFNPNGTWTRHNYSDWVDKNFYVFRQVHILHLQKLNMWTAILKNKIVEPLHKI